jgi:hypothetical protein
MTLSIDSVKRWWRNGNGEHPAPSAPVANCCCEAKVAGPEPPSLPRSPWKEQWTRFGNPTHAEHPSTTLGRMLDQTADRFGESVALSYNHTKRWTYHDCAPK